MNLLMKLVAVMLMTALPEFVLAADSAEQPLDLTAHWVGLFAIVIFIPAAIMSFAVPDEHPVASQKTITLMRGARRIIGLFLLTIMTAVSFHNSLHLPPVIALGYVASIYARLWINESYFQIN